MPRHTWTEADDNEVRRRINLEQTYTEIGAAIGVSKDAVAHRIQRLGLGSHSRSAFIRTRRFKGKKRPKAVRIKVAQANRERAKDPSHRERLQRFGTEQSSNPARVRASQRAMDRKRGGPIPPEHAETMRFLRERKRLTSAEAFAVIRQLPSTSLTIPGA